MFMPLGKELEDWLDFGSSIFHTRASLYEIVMSMDIYTKSKTNQTSMFCNIGFCHNFKSIK